MKERTFYTIEKRHNLYTLWKHLEGGHSVGCIGVYTAETLKDVQLYAAEHKIKVKKVIKWNFIYQNMMLNMT